MLYLPHAPAGSLVDSNTAGVEHSPSLEDRLFDHPAMQGTSELCTTKDPSRMRRLLARRTGEMRFATGVLIEASRALRGPRC